TLSFYEVELLRLLHERLGQPVSRDEILNKIWVLEASPTNRTIDNFIVKLRRKIEQKPDKPEHILTVYGFGYKLVERAGPGAPGAPLAGGAGGRSGTGRHTPRSARLRAGQGSRRASPEPGAWAPSDWSGASG